LFKFGSGYLPQVQHTNIYRKWSHVTYKPISPADNPAQLELIVRGRAITTFI